MPREPKYPHQPQKKTPLFPHVPKGRQAMTRVPSPAQKLLTESVRKALPPLYATEKQKDPVVQVKFFAPWTNWTWYATEFDGEDTFFGYVVGFEKELGYFSLSEMQSVTGPGGLKIERDMYFDPKPLSEVMAEHGDRMPAVGDYKRVPQSGMPRELPTFKGYTVDHRLRQFRKVEYGKPIEYIPFNTPKGRQLLNEMEEGRKVMKIDARGWSGSQTRSFIDQYPPNLYRTIAVVHRHKLTTQADIDTFYDKAVGEAAEMVMIQEYGQTAYIPIHGPRVPQIYVGEDGSVFMLHGVYYTERKASTLAEHVRQTEGVSVAVQEVMGRWAVYKGTKDLLDRLPQSGGDPYPRYRIFDGQHYRLCDFETSKEKAEASASDLRREGYKVRIIETRDGFNIYQTERHDYPTHPKYKHYYVVVDTRQFIRVDDKEPRLVTFDSPKGRAMIMDILYDVDEAIKERERGQTKKLSDFTLADLQLIKGEGQRQFRTPQTEDPCPACGGPLMQMGVLGKKEWYRCRNCGMETHKDIDRPDARR